MYEPKINQITEPDVSKNKASVESFLSLGFGARGDDLPKDYDVKMEGWENIDSVKTAKLALVPKNEKLRNTYNKIILWIDPVRDVSLQQQFFESAGNYRLTHYASLKINGRLPSDAFNINTSAHPKTVHPQ
jgi:outer membrane lipoprotein-sorting protein